MVCKPCKTVAYLFFFFRSEETIEIICKLRASLVPLRLLIITKDKIFISTCIQHFFLWIIFQTLWDFLTLKKQQRLDCFICKSGNVFFSAGYKSFHSFTFHLSNVIQWWSESEIQSKHFNLFIQLNQLKYLHVYIKLFIYRQEDHYSQLHWIPH